jgi:MoaA/NifB/PqqE/SkfB family radical SAM enzyme
MIAEARQNYLDSYLGTVPEAAAYLGNIAELPEAVRLAGQLHLVDPSTPAAALAETSGLSPKEVEALYAGMQTDGLYQKLVTSPFYPRRMMHHMGASTQRDWAADPEYAAKVLKGEAVAPRNLEVHATRGSCDYTCTMCLWSDKTDKTYRTLNLIDSGNGLMQTPDWITVFKDAKELGTERIVFSGGGEPMLNKELFGLSAEARAMGLQTQLYTNGFGLRKSTEADWAEAVQMEQIRFSMHSPTPDIYDKIVEMPEHAEALPTVANNIRELIARRDAAGASVRVGIGFVTQALNYHQIEEMVDFAHGLGVDFINLRQDEVEVTRELTDAERRQIAEQLISVRERTLRGDFGDMYVDMSDDMTAMANGLQQTVRSVGACSVTWLRPAISPYGLLAPCDLRAEPRFYDKGYALGNVRRETLPIVVANAAGRTVAANCAQCMPSGRTINSVMDKFSVDQAAGLPYDKQPFLARQ